MIYYLDDDKDDLLVFVDVMISLNKKVMVFETIDAFYQQLEEPDESPEMIFVDLVLNGFSGHDVVRKIRQMPKFAKTPIAIFTGLHDEKTAERSMESGADYHLVKSGDYFMLEHRLKELIELRKDSPATNYYTNGR
jgi:response regulator RpfG family c-di-GMP phosphodiesterase